MTPWLALVALAFGGDRTDCTVDDSFPIIGTSGYANALSALRSNAVTYGATQFAERNVLRQVAMGEEDKGFVFAIDSHMSWNVAEVPVWQEDVQWGDCPDEYLISSRGTDLQAHNLGFAFRVGRIGGFYAASVTWGSLAPLDYQRFMVNAPMGPMVGYLAAVTLPIFGSWQTGAGTSACAQDFIFGLTADVEVGTVHVGYTQSKGLYGGFTEPRLGLFGNLLLADRLRLVDQFIGGVRQVPLGSIDDKIGRPSLFARSLPLTEPEVDSADTTAAPTVESLLTGHFAQEGLGRVIDLRAAYAVKPVATLHQASVALTTPGYHLTTEDEDGGDPVMGGLIEAGMVTLPDQYYYGLPGGRFLSFRATVGAETPTMKGAISLMINDAEQLALYPFSRNAVTLQFGISGGM
jgi:hypothetical protein